MLNITIVKLGSISLDCTCAIDGFNVIDKLQGLYGGSFVGRPYNPLWLSYGSDFDDVIFVVVNSMVVCNYDVIFGI